jgi:hypothetical protein
MPSSFIRVVHGQLKQGSLLVDKLDDGQANTEGYANRAKNPVYIPFSNPLDPNVAGYLDLVPSDRVLLSVDRGTIKGFLDNGQISASFSFVSSMVAAPLIVTNVIGPTLDIVGSQFVSLVPDVSYVTLFNPFLGLTQVLTDAAILAAGPPNVFTPALISIAPPLITIGVAAPGWTVQIFANSKLSNLHVLI